MVWLRGERAWLILAEQRPGFYLVGGEGLWVAVGDLEAVRSGLEQPILRSNKAEAVDEVMSLLCWFPRAAETSQVSQNSR